MTTQAAGESGPALKERVAEEVRALMGRRNMSRVKLAEQLGQSRTYVGRRLSAETAFDLDDLEAIAAIFDVPVASLMGVVPFPPRTGPGGPAGDAPAGSTTGRNSPDTAGAVIELASLSRAA